MDTKLQSAVRGALTDEHIIYLTSEEQNLLLVVTTKRQCGRPLGSHDRMEEGGRGGLPVYVHSSVTADSGDTGIQDKTQTITITEYFKH